MERNIETIRIAYEDLLSNSRVYSYLDGNPYRMDDDTIITEAEQRLFRAGVQWQCSICYFVGVREASYKGFAFKESCFGEEGKNVCEARLNISLKDLLLKFRCKYPSMFNSDTYRRIGNYTYSTIDGKGITEEKLYSLKGLQLLHTRCFWGFRNDCSDSSQPRSMSHFVTLPIDKTQCANIIRREIIQSRIMHFQQLLEYPENCITYYPENVAIFNKEFKQRVRELLDEAVQIRDDNEQ